MSPTRSGFKGRTAPPSAPPPAVTAPARPSPLVTPPPLPVFKPYEVIEVTLEEGKKMRAEVVTAESPQFAVLSGKTLWKASTTFRINGCQFDKGSLLLLPAELAAAWHPFLASA